MLEAAVPLPRHEQRQGAAAGRGAGDLDQGLGMSAAVCEARPHRCILWGSPTRMQRLVQQCVRLAHTERSWRIHELVKPMFKRK